ncbi:uncharacterized protein PHALS_15357 [Plasmopara halstedii]|uniref:Uncharacterized protein n=1 Tax=Plasmopara halstedii TaxID=4781 RepID=A0A0P1ADW4_PLAHL|nr:uncharacterized protein PHALS_15357 [Plasmopara halstedii]CEG39088.1 hypothetical protein PHALS_15357 [Plasmopara halstedii]|eukprot:XP_024575457.1 hypothetical protein PHALS_15357 [Plasmopara halstedii]
MSLEQKILNSVPMLSFSPCMETNSLSLDFKLSRMAELMNIYASPTHVVLEHFIRNECLQMSDHCFQPSATNCATPSRPTKRQCILSVPCYQARYVSIANFILAENAVLFRLVRRNRRQALDTLVSTSPN